MAESQKIRDRAVESIMLAAPATGALVEEMLARITAADEAPLDLLCDLLERLGPHEAECAALLQIAVSTYGVEGRRGRYQDVGPVELRRNRTWWTDLFANLLQGATMTIEVARSCAREAKAVEARQWSYRAVWSLALMAGVFRAVWGPRPHLFRLLLVRAAGLSGRASMESYRGAARSPEVAPLVAEEAECGVSTVRYPAHA